MKLFMITVYTAMGLLIFPTVAHSQSNFSGTYTMSSEGTTLTLTIQEDQPTTQAKSPTSGNLSGKVLKEPSWGFQFAVPEGWVSQQSADGAILGHNTIAGMILVLPHQIKNIQSLHQELAGGLQDEGVSLMVSGSLQQIGNNALAGEYSGYIQGEQAKAWGIGTLSPYGGGAYIIAATTPEKYGKEIKSAADAIAANMQYFKPEVTDVMRHFVGKWVTTTGSTTDNMYLYPDGTYSNYYEASYSGNFSNGSGGNTGNWGAANQESSRGRWTVKGDKDSGQIIVTYPNGNQSVYNYRVHVERGEYYYNEYNMNGSHYWKTALE